MKLKATLEEIQRRFDSLGESIDERLQSNEYLGLVRKAFRAWDEADTEEKRHYTANLIVTAARTIRRAIRLILISRFLERIGDISPT